MQVVRSSPVYDVVVIGSGAGGGTMVKVLTNLGINVALLEAGPMLNPASDFKEHMWPVPGTRTAAPTKTARSYFGKGPRSFGFFSAPNGGWHLEGEPYTVAAGNTVRWFRSRILGGRTNHYGRISLRFADYDFKPYSATASAPIGPSPTSDIAPYYDKAEGFIGVTGTQGEHPHRARRHLPAAAAAARARDADPEVLQEAEHPVHPVPHGDAHEADRTAAPPATTADNAAAAA